MEIKEKYRFIILLGKALHKYGIPSYSIQDYLSKLAENVGVKGTFMDSPTWINYVFYDQEGEQCYNYIESVAPGTLNLGAYSRIVETAELVVANKMNYSEMCDRLDSIHRKTLRVNHWLLTLAYALAAATFNLMIGSNWISVAVSALLGALVYLLVFLSSRYSYLNSVLESIASFVVTVLAGILSIIFPQLNIGLNIVAAIIIFVPGLAITSALEEITNKSLVSGTAKLFDAIISLFKQFFGVILGLTCLSFLTHFNIYNHRPETPYWVIFLAIPLFSLSLIPILQVRKKDLIAGILTGLVGFFVPYFTAAAGVLFSTFMGTIAVVITATLISKYKHSPKTIFITQGVIMLVPGSKTLFGLSDVFLNTNIVNATNLGEQVAYILMGILGGLLFGGVFSHEQKQIQP